MINWPDKYEIRQLLTLTGISGASIELIHWYVHDCDEREFHTEWFQEDNAHKRIKLNSLLQSRFFELSANLKKQ